MAATQQDAERLASELAAAMPRLNERSQGLAITLYRLLAQGRPVTRGRLAAGAGVAGDDVREFLEGQPGVYYDGEGRVVGFSGLTLTGMPHVMRLDGQRVHAWCAWDTLFLPELIGMTAAVESPCPTTGQTVTLIVDADGVRNVSPSRAVLSFLRPEKSFDTDPIKSFCHFVHFFADEDAARVWTANYPGTFVLAIEDGFEIGKRVNRAVFGAAFEAEE